MNPESNDPSKMTENIMSTIRSQNRKGRALVSTALCLGILAIIVSVGIAWANRILITPMEQLVLEDYQTAAQHSGKNVEGKPVLSKEELELKHAQVTLGHGKAIFMTDVSIAVLAIGTVVILLLVNLNRRMTLRQINESLAQISSQLNELQRRQGS